MTDFSPKHEQADEVAQENERKAQSQFEEQARFHSAQVNLLSGYFERR
jgi:hypothetical protein